MRNLIVKFLNDYGFYPFSIRDNCFYSYGCDGTIKTARKKMKQCKLWFKSQKKKVKRSILKND